MRARPIPLSKLLTGQVVFSSPFNTVSSLPFPRVAHLSRSFLAFAGSPVFPLSGFVLQDLRSIP